MSRRDLKWYLFLVALLALLADAFFSYRSQVAARQSQHHTIALTAVSASTVAPAPIHLLP